MRLAALILASGLLAGTAAAQHSNAEIDASLVAKIEGQMVMPEKAAPISEYFRFYVVTEALDRWVVRGVYLRAFGPYYGRRGIAIEGLDGAFKMESASSMPVVYDGGCDVIEVMFDLELQTLWARGKVGEDALTREAHEPTGICNGLA